MQIQTDFDTEESKQVQKDSQPDLSTTEIAQFNTTSIGRIYGFSLLN